MDPHNSSGWGHGRAATCTAQVDCRPTDVRCLRPPTHTCNAPICWLSPHTHHSSDADETWSEDEGEEAQLTRGGKLALPPLLGDRLRKADAMPADVMHGIVSGCCWELGLLGSAFGL